MAKAKIAPRRPRKAASERLMPPQGCVTVRMYRIGHGDCFLLAFPGAAAGEPVYVLIDCGYKPGSPAFIDQNEKADAGDIAESIRKATGGHIHIAVITHEHQDHVNGFTQTNFKGITIGETWLAWTEDPSDELANQLRVRFKDSLLGLLEARRSLAAASMDESVRRIDEMLAFELGGVDENLLGASGTDPSKSANKVSMKLIKDRAAGGVTYLRPHGEVLALPGAQDVRVFVLGPPHDIPLLESLDPEGSEKFPIGPGSFLGAVTQQGEKSPFAPRYWVPQKQAGRDERWGEFYRTFYGDQGDATPGDRDDQAPGNAAWRRIQDDWLISAESLALAMNSKTNNASLVLAFELGKGGKVLLFAADAQRGNWISWPDDTWRDGADRITAQDLLARTVLYKVGHHGSHNATLNGAQADPYPNISWMATSSESAREFTAMITAVRKWADTQNGWDHPKQSIKDALLAKAAGRVLQTDTNLDAMAMVGEGGEAEWKAFEKRRSGNRLYFDYTVEIG